MIKNVYFLFGVQRDKTNIIKDLLKFYREYDLKCTFVVDYDIGRSYSLQRSLGKDYDAILVDPTTSTVKSITDAILKSKHHGFTTVCLYNDKTVERIPMVDHTINVTTFNPNDFLSLGKKDKKNTVINKQEKKEQKEKQEENEDDE